MEVFIRSLLIIALTFISFKVKAPTFSANEISDGRINSISRMISTIQPKLANKKKLTIAKAIHEISETYKIDPKILIAIIDAESEFDNSKVSPTGDYSVAQINLKVWTNGFQKIGFKKLDVKRLKTDEVYAITKMSQILKSIKDRYGKKDKRWFARYHSHTSKYKNIYYVKLEKRMNKIAFTRF